MRASVSALLPIPPAMTLCRSSFLSPHPAAYHRLEISVYSSRLPNRKFVKVAKAAKATSGQLGDVGNDEEQQNVMEAKEQKEEACYGLADILSEHGLSREDATSVSFRAPAYVKSLIDAALELDEVASWSSGLTEVIHSPQTLRQRVYSVGKQMKSGRHISALLESLGVEMRYIPRILHTVASQSLPELFNKMSFLEELFTGPNEKKNLEMLIRQMMMHTSIPADDDLQKTFSFFEKVDAQRGGLSALSSPRKAVMHCITEFPEILERKSLPDLRSVIAYLERLGIPRESLGYVVLAFPPILLYDVETGLKLRMRSLKKVGIRARDLGRMLVKYPWILDENVENNVEEIAAFLVSIKVPISQVDVSITKCPRLLGCSSSKLTLMIQRMNNMDVKSKRLGYVIARSPQLLVRSERLFDEVLAYLENLGLEVKDLTSLLKKSPEIYATSVSVLQSKIDFLSNIGVRHMCLKRIVMKYDGVLLASIEGNLKPRVEFLRAMGLSDEDIVFMICRFPPVLGYSVDEVLKPKLDFLIAAGRCVREVISYPRFFSYCLEKKIKPRFRVLMRQKVKFQLQEILSKNDDEFAASYLGVSHLYIPPI